MVQQIVQRCDVSLCHLKSLVLGQLSILPQLRQERPQPIERLVQILHPASLPRIGGQPPLPQHYRRDAVLIAAHHRRHRVPATLLVVEAVVRVTVLVAGRRGRRTPPTGDTLRRWHHVNVTECVWRFHLANSKNNKTRVKNDM